MAEVEEVNLGGGPAVGWVQKIDVVLSSDIVDRAVKERFQEFLELDRLSPKQIAWINREHAAVVQYAGDIARIEELLAHHGATDREREAFGEMHGRNKPFTEAQRKWLGDVCERLGIDVDAEGSQNLWSSGKVPVGVEPPGGRVKLPFELPGYEKPTKPPGRR